MTQQLKQPLLKISLLVLVAFLLSYSSYSQTVPLNVPNENLPRVFSSVSDTVPVSIPAFIALLNKQSGDRINISANNELVIDGTVQAVSSKYDGAINTITILLNSSQKLLMVFSKINLPEGVSYQARITGKKTGDCFEMVKSGNEYVFVKKNINRVRPE